MKFSKELIRKAHELTKEIKGKYSDVNYSFQFGICLKYLLSKEEENKMKFEFKTLKGNLLNIETKIRVCNNAGYSAELEVSAATLDETKIEKDGKVFMMTVETVHTNGEKIVAIRCEYDACKQILKQLKMRRTKSCLIKAGPELTDYYLNVFPKEAEREIEKRKAEKAEKNEKLFNAIKDDDIIKINHNSSYGFNFQCKARESKFFTELKEMLEKTKFEIESKYQTDYDWGDYTITQFYEIPFSDLKEIYEAVKIKFKKIQTEKAKKEKERKEAREKIFQTAKETGKRQELDSWSEPCNDPDEECDVDNVVLYALPDGKTDKVRYHTW